MKITNRALIEFDVKFPFVHLIYGRDLFEHAFAEASDDTKRLAKSSIEELTKECAEAETRGDRATSIVIEHFLSARLLKSQTNTALISAGVSVCATLGAVFLGHYIR